MTTSQYKTRIENQKETISELREQISVLEDEALGFTDKLESFQKLKLVLRSISNEIEDELDELNEDEEEEEEF